MKFADAILYIGASQSIFAAFVLMTKPRVQLADRLMTACLLTIALKFTILIMYNIHGEFFDAEFSLGLIPLTFGPFLYLYTCYLTKPEPGFRIRDLGHFLPFVLVTFAYFAFFKEEVNYSDSAYLSTDEYLWVRMVYALVFFTSIIVYTVLTFLRLSQYRRQINSQFSYSNSSVRLLWLNFIAGLFSFSFAIYFVLGSINALSFDKVIDTALVSHIGLTTMAFSISYFSLRQPRLFRQSSTELPKAKARLKVHTNDETERENSGDRSNKARFTETEANLLQSKLERIMKEERPYLQPELTLNDLSILMNLPKHELTYLLNTHIGKNFFTYVNEYRLESVIRKLETPDFDHLTIIAIAYDCGFNSKSTFNSLFKQHTGQTPSEYKKNRA